MRWTANDTAAYNAVSDAGERMRRAWEERQAGEAYEAGVKGLGRFDTEESIANREAGNMQGDMVQARDGTMHAPSEQAVQEMRGYAEAAPGLMRDPTGREKRRAGYESQANFYAGRGDTKNAEALYDRIEGMTDQDQAREFRGLQMAKTKGDMAHDAQLRPLQLEQAGNQNKATKMALDEAGVTQELVGAIRKGKPGIFEFYSQGVPDGWHVEERKGKDGMYEAVQVRGTGKDKEYGEVMSKYKNDDDLIGQVMMGSSKFLPDVISMRQRAAQHSETLAAQKAHWGAIQSKAERPNPTTVLTEKADALSMAYMKADPSLSKEAASARAWQVLTKDPALGGEVKDNAEFTKAMVGLGPRPPKVSGWFSDNDNAGKDWDRQKSWIDQVYGKGGGGATDKLLAAAKDGKDPFAVNQKPAEQSVDSGSQNLPSEHAAPEKRWVPRKTFVQNGVPVVEEIEIGTGEMRIRRAGMVGSGLPGLTN